MTCCHAMSYLCSLMSFFPWLHSVFTITAISTVFHHYDLYLYSSPFVALHIAYNPLHPRLPSYCLSTPPRSTQPQSSPKLTSHIHPHPKCASPKSTSFAPHPPNTTIESPASPSPPNALTPPTEPITSQSRRESSTALPRRAAARSRERTVRRVQNASRPRRRWRFWTGS